MFFSGRLRKIKGEREVFSGEGLPSEGYRGERDIFSGEGLPREGERGETGCFIQGD
jgi:hypothetical protein